MSAHNFDQALAPRSENHCRPRLSERTYPEISTRGKGVPIAPAEGYSRVSDAEMKEIVKNAVDQVYRFSVMKKTDLARYEKLIAYGKEVARN